MKKMTGAPNVRIQKNLTDDLTTFLTQESFFKHESILAALLTRYDIEDLKNYGQWLLQEFERCPSSKQPSPYDLLVSFLDLARTSEVLRRVQEENQGDAWFALLLKIIKKTNFTTARLFRQRVNRYAEKTLFRIITDKTVENHSWQDVSHQVNRLASSLLSAINRSSSAAPVAILSNNRLEMILVDLACLCYGIRNVMIPVNSVQNHVQYILRETQAQILFVSREEHLDKVLEIRKSLEHLRMIVSFQERKVQAHEDLLSLQDFLELYDRQTPEKLETVANRVRLNHVASVMYTSGTTEAPKGIKFSQLNIVSKRFARAIALPEIGDDDTFLCYLPLFHTFGRWFEMLGCAFWGSSYVFMQNPSLETMMDNMKRIQPTIFISIPKKWIQLYEKILEKVDGDLADDKAIRQAIRECTGGKLRWGLSAAGYLDPEIFQFFQHHGIELMSGFGMTEATGGITMTPPGRYKPNSVGEPLPGIKIRLAPDGEMMIKGPYVMKGYLNYESENFREDWFHTGDIFAHDDEGFFSILDRKKEIYKNVRGETIAPQKIENLFRDFDVLRSVYLVGDHREYNTVLIYPNYQYEMIDLSSRTRGELREFFGSIVASVNRFLAPYERIVNFTIVDRDFDVKYGEITEKGTYKRKVINQNFRAEIEKMYEKPYAAVTLCGVELRIPNWLLRQKGLTADDIGVRKSGITLKPSKTFLAVKCRSGEPNKLVLGSGSYHLRSSVINLGELIEHPTLWLGNLELENFVGEELFDRPRLQEVCDSDIQMAATTRVHKVSKNTAAAFNNILAQQTLDLKSLHTCAFILHGDNVDLALKAVRHLEGFLKEPNVLGPLARLALQRAAWIKNTKLMRDAFKTLILNESDNYFLGTLAEFLDSNPAVLNATTIAAICKHHLSDHKVRSVVKLLGKYLAADDRQKKPKPVRPLSLLKFLTNYAMAHPIWYKSIRGELYKWSIFEQEKEIRDYASRMIVRIRTNFREWLGPNQEIAVDSDTGLEYGWPEVVTFEEGISSTDRARLSAAIEKAAVIREAIFLFTRGTSIRLQDVPSKGIWVSFLGCRHGKSVFRVSVQTRHSGSFDLAINLNQSLKKDEVVSEIEWLVAASADENRDQLVEDFGGYWPEFNLWTEEFIAGDTVSKFFEKHQRQADKALEHRAQLLWSYMVWNGLRAYVDFWCRTGRSQVIADPSPDNVIVPPHDYHTGSRIVSISHRQSFESILKLVTSFYCNFVQKIQRTHKQLKIPTPWDSIFSAFLEVLGDMDGLQILRDTLGQMANEANDIPIELPATFTKKLGSYIKSVEQKGFRPQRLHFAIKRFERWLNLNPEAIPLAQMQTLQELSSTYGLEHLEASCPGTRVQYFRDTVFARSEKKFIKALDQLVLFQRQENLLFDRLANRISELRGSFNLDEAEDFYLTRMMYPHLAPSDAAEVISITEEGAPKTDLVVFVRDHYSNVLSIRHPATPKEIAHLHRLFIQANLPVEFQPEHQFLVVLDEKAHVIGGLFYRRILDTTVHLEKIVVAPTHRKHGISDGLLNEFFSRLQNESVNIVTVGFLRPEFFYRFGFKIDHRYGNMVKRLDRSQVSETVGDFTAAVS